MKYSTLMLTVTAILFSGCSTVNRGSNDHFRIDTVPQGAKATTSPINTPQIKRRKKQYGRIQYDTEGLPYHSCEPTPCAIKLPRRSEFVVTLEHPEYETTEIFIRSTTMKGGTTANAAANLATASGSGLAVGGMVIAPFASLSNLLSLSSPSVNASGIASSGAAAGLGVGVGMVAIDIATGANLNLFPNPVVIEMAKKGQPVRTDPLIEFYWDMKEAEKLSSKICAQRKKDRDETMPSCQQARQEFQEKRALFRTLKKEQIDAFRASVKAVKVKQKEKALSTK